MNLALSILFREKGMSTDEAFAAFREAKQEDPKSMVPRALGIVVRQLRKRKECPERN